MSDDTKHPLIRSSTSAFAADDYPLQELADDGARIAHERLFHVHRGVRRIDADYVLVFDNAPLRGSTKRDDALADLAARLSAAGLSVVATGAYPGLDGEQPAYTRTLVLIAPGRGATDVVVSCWNEILRERY